MVWSIRVYTFGHCVNNLHHYQHGHHQLVHGTILWRWIGFCTYVENYSLMILLCMYVLYKSSRPHLLEYQNVLARPLLMWLSISFPFFLCFIVLLQSPQLFWPIQYNHNYYASPHQNCLCCSFQFAIQKWPFTSIKKTSMSFPYITLYKYVWNTVFIIYLSCSKFVLQHKNNRLDTHYYLKIELYVIRSVYLVHTQYYTHPPNRNGIEKYCKYSKRKRHID
jgi:hypothetical protein